LIGCFTTNSWSALLAGSGMILGAGYSLWLCNRMGDEKCPKRGTKV
jgi:NADH:ubiquinone oxidoreductase subunit 4 (subunit M)